MIDFINKVDEKNTFLQGLVLWSGYDPVIIPYTRRKRELGRSRWTLSAKLKYFVDGRPGYRCHLPKLVMFVDGRGYVENCLNLDRPIANIRETPLKEIMALQPFKQLRRDAEECSSCYSPTMVDLSHVWENPQLVFESGGVAIA